MSVSECEDFAEFTIRSNDPLHARAVRELIARHQDEFYELSGQAARERMEALQRQVARTLREIEQLRAANPDGVAVPALTETANALVAENDKLTQEYKRLTRNIERLKRENDKLRHQVADLLEGDRDE